MTRLKKGITMKKRSKILCLIIVFVMVMMIYTNAFAAYFARKNVYGGPTAQTLISSWARGEDNFRYDLEVILNGQRNITYRVYYGSNKASDTFILTSSYGGTGYYWPQYANTTLGMQLKATIPSESTSDYAITSGYFTA